MSTIQQMLLGVGAVADKIYVDDIFSTTLYKSTGSAGTISTGINNATDGGMLWVKSRTDSVNHGIWDTVRTNGYYLPVNDTDNGGNISAASGSSPFLRDGGFRWNSDHNWFNKNNSKYAAFNFKKTTGFFTIKEYTGTGSSQAISHDLGSMPGLIIIKLTSSSGGDWTVYHRDLGTEPELGQQKYLMLNRTNAAFGDGAKFSAAPTDTTFSVGTSNDVNGSGNTYIAYLFAGGESTAATARSVDFDGSGDYLSIPDNDAWDISSSDATIECWVKFDSHNGHDGIIHNFHSSGLPGNGTSGWALEPVSGIFNLYWGTTAGGYGNVQGAKIPLGQWQHLAVTKSGSTITLYQDGVKTGSGSISGTINSGVEPLQIGGNCVGEDCDCKISNVRITKGQVLYTSSFKPSTVPLTTTSQGATASNVKLLCCNNSSTTGSTVTPGTITANGNPTASTDSPLDDPAGFVFGENEDQNVISAGSYIGNGSSTGPEIFLGWEPSWILLKNASAASRDWKIVDAMRGIVTGGDDASLRPNESNAEDDESVIDLTPTGFKITASNAHYNENGETIIYCAIRRPDGYVGKPPELGTGVFTPILNATDSAEPFYRAANHVVDFALAKRYDTAESWFSSSRLIQGKYLQTDTTSAEQSNSYQQFDYQSGYNSFTGSAGNNIGYLWKRHAGFDVVAYTGDGVAGRQINHSMNKAVEMIWVKKRSATDNWIVGQKGLNGGTNPWHYEIVLNSDGTQANNVNKWNDTAPTSSHFTLGNGDAVNKDGEAFIAMLFASVEGISKCGYFDGSDSAQTIEFGFSARFLIIKSSTHGYHWNVLDTVRGITSGSNTDDKYLRLSNSNAQGDHTFGALTSTGFTFDGGQADSNDAGKSYIYYAHS